MYDFHSRSRKVAERFIQSVVILDDFANFGEQVNEQVDQLKAPELGGTSGSSTGHSQQSGTLGENRNRENVPLDAKAVIDRFAELGSVCAVLRPAREEEFQQKFVKAAMRADVVILDWKIDDSYGVKTLEVIRCMLEHDQDGGRLRLVAIYTGEPDLEDITQKVAKTIEESYAHGELAVDNDALRISKGPVHAVIFAKDETNLVAKAHQNQVVAESELPDRLIDEFSGITEGLLSNVALAGLAAIRTQAHKLLLKFDPDLDAAYLGHRLLLRNPKDAEDHVVDALGAEINSILEEQRPGDEAGIEAIREWLIASPAKQVDISSPIESGVEPVKKWLLLLTEGLYTEGISLPDKKKNIERSATNIFAKNCVTANQSNRLFATLLNLKSRYSGSRAPRLVVGTILSAGDGEDVKYFVCLQPKCDSVRIKCQTGFPFLALATKTHNEKFDLVIDVGADQWKYFELSRKPSALIVPSFNPTPNSGGQVVAGVESDGNYFFMDSANVKYKWIVGMKDEHGLKIANELAAVLSRPGPNDTEWLRRASRR